MSDFDIAYSKAFAEFDKQLRAFEKISMNSMGELLWRYSSIFAGLLVRYTQPNRAASKAQKVGQKAIARDVAKAYPSAGSIYLEIRKTQQNAADAFYKAYQAGERAQVDSLIKQFGGSYQDVEMFAWDGGRAHSANRTRSGRVNRQSTVRGRRLVTVDDRNQLNAYRQKLFKKVGFTKSGWVSGFRPPGGMRSVPNWVKSLRGNHGKVYDETRSGVFRNIIFNNKVPWIGRNISKGALNTALNAVVRKIKKDMEKEVKQASRKV